MLHKVCEDCKGSGCIVCRYVGEYVIEPHFDCPECGFGSMVALYPDGHMQCVRMGHDVFIKPEGAYK